MIDFFPGPTTHSGPIEFEIDLKTPTLEEMRAVSVFDTTHFSRLTPIVPFHSGRYVLAACPMVGLPPGESFGLTHLVALGNSGDESKLPGELRVRAPMLSGDLFVDYHGKFHLACGEWHGHHTARTFSIHLLKPEDVHGGTFIIRIVKFLG